ncbi:MAG: CRISPR-associated endonuclease Cas1 [bacterium]|nr:CRISPR-associated endonuclease Cas1 [bacterium]
MANIYLTEQGSILRKTGDRLIVQKDNETLLDIQCNKIDAVLIFGNVQFTTQAVHELFEHGIEMAIMTRTGRLIGQITSPMPKNVYLRLAQYEKYKDESFITKISKIIVAGKIQNEIEFIRRFSYNHPEIRLIDEIERLERYRKDIEGRNTIAELLGVEGASAKEYFTAFNKMILGAFNFDGRRKRPATDPVNALLSFGYTLVFNEISSLLDGIGFDQYIGYYHKIDYGRPSLAADLLEEFRTPIVDRFTLKLINNRVFKEDAFFLHTQSGGIYLKQEAMKRYFVEYEHYINEIFTHPQTKENTNFRKCIRIQIEKLARGITTDGKYQPFHFDR